MPQAISIHDGDSIVPWIMIRNIHPVAAMAITATTQFCGLSMQVVSHGRENKHDFEMTVPGKWWMCVSLSWSHFTCTGAVQWRHNERDGVSNHQPHDCLLNRLFRCRSKKTSKLRVTGLCGGTHRWAVNPPHKGPVTRKMFPFDDVIMRLARPGNPCTSWFLCCWCVRLLTALTHNVMERTRVLGNTISQWICNRIYISLLM